MGGLMPSLGLRGSKNAEAWDIKYDPEGNITNITVHRDVGYN